MTAPASACGDDRPALAMSGLPAPGADAAPADDDAWLGYESALPTWVNGWPAAGGGRADGEPH